MLISFAFKLFFFICILYNKFGFGQDIIYDSKQTKYNAIKMNDIFKSMDTKLEREPKGLYTALPVDFYDKLIMLNIGGVTATDGWYNVNAQESKDTRNNNNLILREMDNLYGIRSQSVGCIYSSHALEHTSSAGGEVMKTLKEWKRVLKYGGLLMLAVPDLEVLSRLFLKGSYPMSMHLSIATMMFGAQSDIYDYHYTGFDVDFLHTVLEKAGFCDIERVSHFNLFPEDYDTSALTFINVPISLNMIARPCVPKDTIIEEFYIQHFASPYIPMPDEDYPLYDSVRKEFYLLTKQAVKNPETNTTEYIVQRQYDDWKL